MDFIAWLNEINKTVDLFAVGKALAALTIVGMLVLDRIMYVKSKSDKGE
jgi:hypothetical protein